MLTRQRQVKLWLKFLLVACVWNAGTAVAAEDRQVLEALAQKYWAAEVAQDYVAVYEMLSPEEQGTMTRADYVTLRKEGGPPRYVTAQLGEIATEGDVAWAYVKFEWMLPRYAYAGSRPGTTWQVWRNVGGWRPIPLSDREQWPVVPPKLRPAADEAALKGRAVGLWQAKVAQDWKSVYGYLPPSFQEHTPLDKFLQSKAKYLYVAPEVQWVEAKGDEARVAIMVGTKYNDPGAKKMQPQRDKVIEPWIKVGGAWYLNAPPPEDTDTPPKEKAN